LKETDSQGKHNKKEREKSAPEDENQSEIGLELNEFYKNNFMKKNLD
jgi:hypothetical protein